MNFGEKVKNLRMRKKLTLEKLAKLTGSSKSYIWQIENETTNPSAGKASRIAFALDVTVEYLLDEEATVSEEEAEDVAFYRKYRRMDPDTKAKVRRYMGKNNMRAIEKDIFRHERKTSEAERLERITDETQEIIWNLPAGEIYDRLQAVPGFFITCGDDARRKEMITQLEDIVADTATILERSLDDL